MKDKKIYDTWKEFVSDQKYKKYFMSYVELWCESFKKLYMYININNKRPRYNKKPRDNRSEEIKTLEKWTDDQLYKFKNKIHTMKNITIYYAWKAFIKDHKKYFIVNKKRNWYENLQKVKKYMDDFGKRPSSYKKKNETEEEKEIRLLGRWIETEQRNYKTKKQFMKDNDVYNAWTELITNNKYKKHFKINK